MPLAAIISLLTVLLNAVVVSSAVIAAWVPLFCSRFIRALVQ